MSQSGDAGPGRLKRQVGLIGAVALGLGSILGTGVFVSLGLAADVAGPAIGLAILIAGFVALCNGLSSAQLAAAHPVAGGTYEYGYQYLNPAFGRIAGWLFLSAKSASAATAALGFAGYLLTAVGAEQAWLVRVVALGAVALLTALVLSGLRRSNAVNAVLVLLTLATLGAFVVIEGGQLGIEEPTDLGGSFTGLTNWAHEGQHFPATLFHAAALAFVAYTGYGRVATLGEEIRKPKRNIPIAVILTLLVSAVVYMVVGFVATASVGPAKFAELTNDTGAPLEAIARYNGNDALAIVVAIGAILAMFGVLLNLILGLSRVALAMGRRRDLPGVFGRVNTAGTTAAPAVLGVGAIIFGLAAIGSIKLAWSFSAATVLVYYALTNLAALRLPKEDRRFPRLIAVLGLAGCLGLCAFIDWPYLAAVGGLAVLGLLGGLRQADAEA